MNEALWIDEPFINRISTRVGPYEIELHTHPESPAGLVDWLVWDRWGEVLDGGITTDVAHAKMEAWLAVGLSLGFVEVTEEETVETPVAVAA